MVVLFPKKKISFQWEHCSSQCWSPLFYL